MTQEFWDAALPIIKRTEVHPFLVAMVENTLDMEKFKYYVIQDALYLTDFSYCLGSLGDKALANGGIHAEEDCKRLKEFAVDIHEAEKSLHTGFFKK